jgi:hypothetical protein
MGTLRDGALDPCQNRRPPAAHPFEGHLSQRRLEIESQLFEMESRPIALGLKPPGNHRIQCPGSFAPSASKLRRQIFSD